MFLSRVLRPAALLIVVAVAGCSDDAPAAPAAEQFAVTLSGANEVPAVTTVANGTASFTAVGDTAISYSITVNGITGVTMGHIHVGAVGVNGGIVAWLLPPNGTAPQAPSGALSGSLSTGTLNASWIRGVGGAPAITLDSLKRLMRAGNAYLNVHTSTNGGGEIRGQIRTN